jgi:hypothetical protein
MRALKRALLMTCAAAALTVAGVACDDDDAAESGSTASQESIDALAIRVERNEQMFALITFGNLGLHAMDEDLNETGEIQFSYSPNTQKLIRLLALTDWGQFQADADELRGHAEALLTALRDENIEVAKDEAHEVHEIEHAFSRLVWNEIAKDLPPDLGGPEQEEEEQESETPPGEHDETPESPAAEATP